MERQAAIAGDSDERPLASAFAFPERLVAVAAANRRYLFLALGIEQLAKDSSRLFAGRRATDLLHPLFNLLPNAGAIERGDVLRPLEGHDLVWQRKTGPQLFEAAKAVLNGRSF